MLYSQCCVPPYKSAKSAWAHSLLFLLQQGRRYPSLSASSLQRPLGAGVLLLQRRFRTAASAWTPFAISNFYGASLAASTPFTISAYLSGWPQAMSAALCADGTQSNVHGQIKIRLQALPEHTVRIHETHTLTLTDWGQHWDQQANQLLDTVDSWHSNQ